MVSPPDRAQWPHSTALQNGKQLPPLLQSVVGKPGIGVKSGFGVKQVLNGTHTPPSWHTLHTPPHPSGAPHAVHVGTHGVGVGPGGGGSQSSVLSLQVCPAGHPL